MGRARVEREGEGPQGLLVPAEDTGSSKPDPGSETPPSALASLHAASWKADPLGRADPGGPGYIWSFFTGRNE